MIKGSYDELLMLTIFVEPYLGWMNEWMSQKLRSDVKEIVRFSNY